MSTDPERLAWLEARVGFSVAENESLMRDHLDRLAKKGTPVRCPVCRTNNFAFTGIEHADRWRTSTSSGAVPRAVLVCENCKHILEFAWLGIR